MNKINNFPKNIQLLYRQIYSRLLSSRFSNVKLNICFERHYIICVLDEIWDLIESVSEGFLTYSLKHLNIKIRKPTVLP